MKKGIGLLCVLAFINAGAQNIIANAELKAKNVNRVKIEGSFVDVFVKKGDEVYFKGTIEGDGDKGDYKFDTNIKESTLIIRVLKERKLGWRGFKTIESRIDLVIPNGVELDIVNSSGDVEVYNLRASESKIRSTSGDILLKGVISNLMVETSSGDIEIYDLIGDSKIRSTSGDQDFNNVKGTLETTASSGDITFIEFEGDIKSTATSGDVKFRDGKGSIKIRTTSGDIDGEDITLNGNSSFEATSGNVRVDFTNNIEDISFNLSATSGGLQVGSQESGNRLIIDSGMYMVRGFTTSGDQEYK